MTVSGWLITIGATIVAALWGWISGAQVGDTRGILGFLLGAITFTAGITYMLNV